MKREHLIYDGGKSQFEVESLKKLELRQSYKILGIIKKIFGTAQSRQIKKYQKMIRFVYQNKPLGTGDAVLKTKKFITDDFFLMLLPDDLIIKKNCSKSMINIHNRYKSSVMASINAVSYTHLTLPTKRIV